MDKVDLVIIGAGPGGYVAASRAGALGMKTLLVEDRALGGTCLNWGCIPAKAMIESGNRYTQVKEAAAFGVKVEGAELDYPTAVARTQKVVGRLTKGVAGLMKARKVEVVMGKASQNQEQHHHGSPSCHRHRNPPGSDLLHQPATFRHRGPGVLPFQ